VGNHPGELVVGDFVNYIQKPTFDWSTYLGNVHLRWQEEGRWYSIDAYRYYWNGDSASQRAERDQLISDALSLGQNMVPLSGGSASMAGQVDQTPTERVGFQIRTPAALPAGFSLEGVWFGTRYIGEEGTIVITYSYMESGKWVAGITLSEAVNPAVDFTASFTGSRYSLRYDLTQDEVVQVGQVMGRYMVRVHDRDMGDSGSTALIWEKDGVKFMLQPTYDESNFGGRFTKAELIAIAEGIK
jgi:hypothetical protein